MLRWIKFFIAGQSKLSPCWLGMHRWSMPGGWCEKCGKCDEFFGPHPGCLDVCKWFEREQLQSFEKEQPQ